MKKINLFLFLALTIALPFLLTGCAELIETHSEALASLDLIKTNNKGVSYVGENDQGEVSWDFGYLLSEGFTFGGNPGASHFYGPGYNGRNLWNASRYNGYDVPACYPGSTTENKKGSSFYLSEGLDFMNKRTKQTSQGYSTTVSLYYLQLPVLANYGFQLHNGNVIHAGFGPYAAAGLFGKIKGSGVNQSVKFGSSSNDDLKRMDYGLTFNAGFRFLGQFDATIGYDLGLRNVSTTPPDPDTKISGFSLKLGYWFH